MTENWAFVISASEYIWGRDFRYRQHVIDCLPSLLFYWATEEISIGLTQQQEQSYNCQLVVRELITKTINLVYVLYFNYILRFPLARKGIACPGRSDDALQRDKSCRLQPLKELWHPGVCGVPYVFERWSIISIWRKRVPGTCCDTKQKKRNLVPRKQLELWCVS